MLALFLYNSFLVARAITRQSEFGELDSVLLALDVGYRGSLAIFFFRKFFEFENTPEVFVETTNSNNECQSKAEGQEIEINLWWNIRKSRGDSEVKREEKGIMVASGKSPKLNAARTFDITDEQNGSNSAKHDL